ncbi:MAG: hypothetical protein M3Q45_11955, partial [Chloroflexota bacterium]|nr:hypothetical protein [Chloroflexota bacterium]
MNRANNIDNASLSMRMVGLYSLLGLATVGLPLLLARWSLPLIRTSDDPSHPLPRFQLFVFCATVALIVAAALQLRKHRTATYAAWLPVLAPLLVALHYLIQLRLYSAKSWDYMCYENAARAIVAGVN